MALKLGREGRIYTKLEAAYGTQETLAATNILRTTPGVSLPFDPFNRVVSPEKQNSPAPVNQFDRKKSGSWNVPFIVRPSGVLNTVPECDPEFEAAFGSKTNVTLSTTVASGPTTTGATVASAGTLAVHDVVSIEVTTQSGKRFLRRLTSVAGAVLTWAPALPAAPSVGDDVKGLITYKPTSLLAKSLTIGQFGTNKDKAAIGAMVDQLSLSLPENEEMSAVASGPAKQVLTSTTTPALQADPATTTFVGGNPPSQLEGELLVDATAYLIRSFQLTLPNGVRLRNQELGVNGPSEGYRVGRREVTLGFNAMAETPASAYNLAEAGTYVSIHLVVGATEGNRIALFLPRVELKIPSESDGEEEQAWDFTGRAFASAIGANDDIFLAIG